MRWYIVRVTTYAYTFTAQLPDPMVGPWLSSVFAEITGNDLVNAKVDVSPWLGHTN